MKSRKFWFLFIIWICLCCELLISSSHCDTSIIHRDHYSSFSIGQWVFGAFLPLPDSTVKMKREDAQRGALGQNQTRVTAACGRLLNPWAKQATYCVFTQTVLNLNLCHFMCNDLWWIVSHWCICSLVNLKPIWLLRGLKANKIKSSEMFL